MPRDANVGEIYGVSLYRNDVVVRRKGDVPPTGETTRGEVKEFSYRSRQRLAFVACNTDTQWRAMLTLTYPESFPTDGAAVKTHLHAFLIWLGRDTRGTSYLWFLEFQRRGAPHIHILIDYPWPTSRVDVKAFRFRIAATWYRIVGSGDTKHLAAGTRAEKLRKPDGGARYAVKYAYKMKQKTVPAGYRNVGRFWGASKGVTPAAQKQVPCTEDDIRGILEGWEYAPKEGKHVYRLLYGRAQAFRDWLAR